MICLRLSQPPPPVGYDLRLDFLLTTLSYDPRCQYLRFTPLTPVAMENKHQANHTNNTDRRRSVASEKHSIFPAHRKRSPLSTMQSHIVAAVAEFVGTFMFLFLAFAGHLMAVAQAPNPVNGAMNNQTVLIIGLAYAISLLVNVWAFYRISGGLFNPAVRIAPQLNPQSWQP